MIKRQMSLTIAYDLHHIGEYQHHSHQKRLETSNRSGYENGSFLHLVPTNSQGGALCYRVLLNNC